VVAIGDMRPYNVALIVLDPDAAASFASAGPARRRARHIGRPSQVTDAVARANGRLSRVEQIKRFRIMPEDWLPGGNEPTPTMKLKRKPITQKYAVEIDAVNSS
jgi:long-subunit acyl-CoA synthetase (AMP-forming)